jgi:uncharacterized protein (DUF885 family)
VPRAFATSVDEFLDEFFRLLPVHATSAGNHDHDGRWPDLTDAGRAERLAFLGRWEETFGRYADADLAPDERIDRDLLLGEIAAARFEETELETERWDALEWNYVLGGGLFPLLAREFAPLADRLTSAAGRLEGVPAVVEAAKATLTGTGERPVSRFHAETALTQLPGVGDLADDAVRAADAAPDDPGVASLRPRLVAAAEAAKRAVEEFTTHLREVVLPAAAGEGRLGRDLFAAKLRHTLRNPDLTPERLLERAERDYTVVRAELVRLARDMWPTWRSGEPVPTAESAGSPEAAESAIVRGVLDAVAAEHPDAPDLLDYCRTELGRIQAFCRDRDLIGLAEEPLEIRWTPVYLRAFGGAMLDSPGPLDKGQKAFFSITPIPEDWTPEQAESYLREDNDRMLRLLTIHEAVPGHYLQGVYANRHPSIVRSVFWSGVFAEGWAVYVTQVMMDAGYGADDPALLLTHWKFYLRAITNAIIDIRIHTMGMTEEEAVSLMVDGGFQEEAEARSKYNRARLTSTQLSTYYVGSLAFWDLEHEVRRRAAAGSGDPRGADAVQVPRLVGGYGETPGFVYRPHLEACISHGSPPMPLLRRVLVG